MKRVLITGASGFIGSNVLKYMLPRTDWEFTAICSWRHKGSPLNVPRDKRVDVVTHDLRGPIPELGHFDYILNLASESHVDRSIQQPVTFVENNIRLMLSVLEYARRSPPDVLLQFSTDEVFGMPGISASEGVCVPSNPYAASKACQEMLAMAYRSTYDVPVVITNSNNVVGPNQDPEKFVPKLIGLIEQNRPVQIHTFGGELGKRFYNPVDNVADALLFILNGFDGHEQCSIPGGVEMDNLEMAILISEILEMQLHYELVEVSGIRPGYDTAYQGADNLLFDLGWTPPQTLEEGLAWIASP